MLRPYQIDIVNRVHEAWQAGARNVVLRADTGAGKTVMIAHIVRSHRGASCIIAHRSELVSQLSSAMAREGVRHNLICSQADRRAISADHAARFGHVYFDPSAPCAIASVDTLVRRDDLADWQRNVTLWVVDEGHHLLANNKWGKAVAAFSHPQVNGLMPTATPRRADGMGLGRHADGVADAMVDGPSARWLIDNGYLTSYKVACVNSHIEEFLGDVSASGDWSNATLRSASQQSQIVGDVVQSYRQFADGKLGITFATDVKTAGEIAAAYRAGGVPADLLTGDTDIALRRSILRRFAEREILQVVAVDVISEGFDLPACEAITMARPTASLATFLQQMGRGLRPMPGKSFCQLIDHVGNFLRHGGGPDTPRVWSLDRRDRRSKAPDDAIPLRICLNVECGQPYERFRRACPYCGTSVPEPAGRAAPDQVAGDLTLLDESVLARLRGDLAATDQTLDEYRAGLVAKYCPPLAIPANVKRHAAKQDAQSVLRELMAALGGQWRAAGLSDGEMQSRFWYTFGMDVITAQTLGIDDANKLIDRIVKVF